MNRKVREPNHILEAAIGLFAKFGVRSVTMDDVAREAGVSKKTIYQHHTDRQGLVIAAIDYHLQGVESCCDEIYTNHSNPIDQLMEISLYFHQTTSQINPNLFFELQKYFPKAWKILSDHRQTYVMENMQRNLAEGIKQGYYREDLNQDIAVKLYAQCVNLILDEEAFPKTIYSFKDLHREIMMYHIHAISTPKGLKYIHKKTNVHVK